MKGVVFAFLLGLVQRFFTRAAQGLWEGLWEQIFAAVAFAERRWVEAGRGAEKRGWAVQTVMGYLDEKAKLGWLQRMIVKLFVGRVVDAVVDTANAELGQDWVARVQELERNLAQRILWLGDMPPVV